jgi:hypothetical protein
MDFFAALRLVFFSASAFCLSTSSYGQTKPYCDIKGAVFVVADRGEAQFRVFVEKSEAFADLAVFKAPNLLFADRSGLWYFSATRAQASYTLAIVPDKAMADFSIFYIDNESFAGCR